MKSLFFSLLLLCCILAAPNSVRGDISPGTTFTYFEKNLAARGDLNVTFVGVQELSGVSYNTFEVIANNSAAARIYAPIFSDVVEESGMLLPEGYNLFLDPVHRFAGEDLWLSYPAAFESVGELHIVLPKFKEEALRIGIEEVVRQFALFFSICSSGTQPMCYSINLEGLDR